jgi:hypothetical protein
VFNVKRANSIEARANRIREHGAALRKTTIPVSRPTISSMLVAA